MLDMTKLSVKYHNMGLEGPSCVHLTDIDPTHKSKQTPVGQGEKGNLIHINVYQKQ